MSIDDLIGAMPDLPKPTPDPPPYPTPWRLRAWAEWFDDPASPNVVVTTPAGRRLTAGYLLRRIAEGMEGT